MDRVFAWPTAQRAAVRPRGNDRFGRQQAADRCSAAAERSEGHECVCRQERVRLCRIGVRRVGRSILARVVQFVQGSIVAPVKASLAPVGTARDPRADGTIVGWFDVVWIAILPP